MQVDARDFKELKKEIKEWEYQFSEEFGRKPTKADISENREIAYKYKMYSKLKSSKSEVPSSTAQESMTTNAVLVPATALPLDKKQSFTVKKVSFHSMGPQSTGNRPELSNNIKNFTFGDNSLKKKSESVDSLNDEINCPEIDAFLSRKLEITSITTGQVQETKLVVEAPAPTEIETIVLPFEPVSAPVARAAFQEDGAIAETHATQETNEPMTDIQIDTTPEPADTRSNGLGVNAKGPQVQNPRIFSRLPNDSSILRCRVIRRRNLLDKAYPTFLMYNESDNTLVLAARKRKKTKSLTYLISTSADDLTKDSHHYVAKLKANGSRTNFILSDARGYNKTSFDKGMSENLCVSYTKTLLPRELSVAIPALSVDLESNQSFTRDIFSDVKSHNTNSLEFLKNKKPRWNEATQSHCLNFGGRVSLPSIKNFQLVKDGDDKLVMQFGRCGPELFTLDARYPLTPVQAFAIALTTFDAFDSALTFIKDLITKVFYMLVTSR